MATRNITALKIKELYYGPVLTVAPTKAKFTTDKTTLSKITNSHQGTFQYEETAPSITQYKNELTSSVYRTNVEPGEVSINFTIGQYDLALKASLQGGEATADTWSKSASSTLLEKAFYALTEDDVLIVFPKAQIVARGASTDGAIGIALQAIPLESTIKSEYWIDMQATA